MSKFSYIIVVLISLFMFGNSVSAKTVEKVCDYNNSDNEMTSKAAVTIKIYSDGTADAIVTKYNNSNRNNSENIQNWSSIKATYQSKKECPVVASVSEDGVFSNMKVWAFYNQEEALKVSTENKATMLDDSRKGVHASDSEKASVAARISEMANYCNSHASTTYDMNKCKDDSKTTTKYEESLFIPCDLSIEKYIA